MNVLDVIRSNKELENCIQIKLIRSISVNSIEGLFIHNNTVKLTAEEKAAKRLLLLSNTGLGSLLWFAHFPLSSTARKLYISRVSEASLPPPITLTLEKVSVGVGANSVLLQRLETGSYSRAEDQL